MVHKLISLALLEDLSLGDITSELCVSKDISGVGYIVARHDFLVCGLPILPQIIKQSGFPLDFELRKHDGESVKSNDILATVSGELRSILSLERTILNFLQRLSGCATHVQKFVSKSGGLIIADTRKTTPGWRVLEKYAVRTGGGRNHRSSLGDMILVKENHIDANGGSVRQTLERIKNEKGIHTPFEVEVRSLSELRDVLPYSPHAIMLDNMDDQMIDQAVKIIREVSKEIQIEVSGGINEARLQSLAKSGISFVSMGILTTAYQCVDISVDIEIGAR